MVEWTSCLLDSLAPPSQISPQYLTQIDSPIVYLMYTGDSCTMTSGYRVERVGSTILVHPYKFLLGSISHSVHQDGSLPLLPTCIICELFALPY